MKNRLPFFTGLLLVVVIAGFGWVWWELRGMKITLSAFARRLDATVADLPNTASPSPLVIGNDRTSIAPLQSAVATLSAHVQQLDREFQALLETSSPTNNTPTTTKSSSSVKETLIFLGSGSSSSTDWTNTTSAQVTIDTTQFPPIKEARFEAALSILGGEAHARLARTDGTAIYLNSEVMNNTSTSTWVGSGPFTLSKGTASYTVQLRSTSSERANLDGARIKLIFE